MILERAGDVDSIAILDARATMEADKDKPVPADIEQAWETVHSSARG